MAQTINVNTTPGQFMPTLYYSQGDIGREFEIVLASSDGWSIPAGATVTMVATKPSGFGFSVAGTLTDNVASFTTTETMTNEHGRYPAEIRITSNGDVIGTANFYLSGERDPHPAETIDGDASEIIPELTLLVERVEAAASSVLDMTVNATTLAAGSQATYSYDEDTNTATFGIPQGEAGAGAVGVTASAYSSSKTYAVGDYVIHNSNLYRCTTAITTAEAFTAGHWTQVVLGDDVSDLKSDITHLTNVKFTESDGYIASDGAVQGASSTTQEKYTNKIAVSNGDKLTINLNFSAFVGIWVAYATYDASGDFISRTTLTESQNDNYTATITAGSGVSYIVFTYRTWGTATKSIYKLASVWSGMEQLHEDDVALKAYIVDATTSASDFGLADLTESYPSSFVMVLSNNIAIDTKGTSCKVKWIAYPYGGKTRLLVLRKENGYIICKKTVEVSVVNGQTYEHQFDYDFIGDGTEYIGIVGVRHNVNITGGQYVVYASTYDSSVTQYSIPQSVNRDSMVAYDFEILNPLKDEVEQSKKENLNVLLMGDSIFGNDGEIAEYLGKMCKSCVNGAFGGTQVSVRPYTSDAFRFFDGVNIITALCNQTWTDQDSASVTLSNQGYTWVPTRLAGLKSVDMSEVDLLIMDWGTNDYTAGATIETITTAYDAVIDLLQATYPELRILVTTPIWRYWGTKEDNENGDTKIYNVSTLKEIALAIEEFMKNKRISVLNAYQNLPLSYNTALTYFDVNDKTHLNAFGNKVYAELLHGKIRSIY